MKTFRTNVVIIFVMIVVFDVAMYLFLPDEYASLFEDYRQGNLLLSSVLRTDDILIRDIHSRGYYVRHPERGFDIRANAQGHHIFNGGSFPVWSNSIGCFDFEHPRYERYVYIAGDSTAWGYTSFDDNFGTILQKLTGKQVLKCGVTHTGSRHQYGKMIEIVEKIGVLPETILVIYESNDLFNDYAHPHSTVVSGYLANNAEIGPDNRVRRTPYEELRKQIEARIIRRRKARECDGWWGLPKTLVRQFSLTAHLGNLLVGKAARMITSDASASGQGYEPAYRNVNTLARDIDGKHWYLDNPFAQANKEALLDFKRFAEENGIRLIVVLMPLKTVAAERDEYFEQTRLFLDKNGIAFIDAAISLARKGVVWSDLYWENDHHENPAGNQAIADVLLEEVPEVFLGTVDQTRTANSGSEPGGNRRASL